MIRIPVSDYLKLAYVAVFAIVLLQSIALYKGLDGIMFGASMSALGVITGYIVKAMLEASKK